MNKNLLNYVKILSKRDTKNLTQKVLKTGEEFGELAKVALPYEGAFATNHRFTTKEKILEECSDIILCALSVAYDLDFSDEDLDKMMSLKSDKWAHLQNNEKDVKYPLPYEIHLTFENVDDEKTFRDLCRVFDVKPLFIINETKNNNSYQDILISAKHYGTNRTAYEYMKSLVEKFTKNNYNIVREKIESVPWNPCSPKGGIDVMPQNCYFECHFPVIIDSDKAGNLRSHVYSWAHRYNSLHISQNPSKKLEDNKVLFYITYRRYGGYLSEFEYVVNEVLHCLKEYNFEVGKLHKEFAIYDSNVSRDFAWMNDA